MNLKPGDVFFVHENRSVLAKLINLVSTMHDVWDKDPSEKSEVDHCGLIKNEKGDTFESNFIIGYDNVHTEYEGVHLMIFRNTDMDNDKFVKGFKAVKQMAGKVYPVHRLFLFLIPGVAKKINSPRLVCSELVGKFLQTAGLRDDNYLGTEPDQLLDEFQTSSKWVLMFDGKVGEINSV